MTRLVYLDGVPVAPEEAARALAAHGLDPGLAVHFAWVDDGTIARGPNKGAVRQRNESGQTRMKPEGAGRKAGGIPYVPVDKEATAAKVAGKQQGSVKPARGDRGDDKPKKKVRGIPYVAVDKEATAAKKASSQQSSVKRPEKGDKDDGPKKKIRGIPYAAVDKEAAISRKKDPKPVRWLGNRNKERSDKTSSVKTRATTTRGEVKLDHHGRRPDGSRRALSSKEMRKVAKEHGLGKDDRVVQKKSGRILHHGKDWLGRKKVSELKHPDSKVAPQAKKSWYEFWR